MKLELRADLGEGPFTVSTNLWCVTQWERKYKTKPLFDDFIKKLVSLEIQSEDTDRPFSEAPTDIP
jgi:hypothetical protein